MKDLSALIPAGYQDSLKATGSTLPPHLAYLDLELSCLISDFLYLYILFFITKIYLGDPR